MVLSGVLLVWCFLGFTSMILGATATNLSALGNQGNSWQPFEPVRRPQVPEIGNFASSSNPIDAFLETERVARGLVARPRASKDVLLRRVYQDLVGLNPTPEEQEEFRSDTSPKAYEKVVERLLADPRHGERWGRHWMDVWRYSDWAGWTDGGQVRDSKPHIWRWRDWIVESLNADRPYDRMIVEMLAADEVAPEDNEALRATGFLVRNYKMLSREQWLEDTIKHTAQAFLGVTIGCAKCHDHMTDPISQREYYSMRAIFEPHQVRIERLPGELDTTKVGLPRAYDSAVTPTWLFRRGDERYPVTNEVIQPGVPSVLGGRLEVREVTIPWQVANPDQREHVLQDQMTAADKVAREAKAGWIAIRNATNSTQAKVFEAELVWDLAAKKQSALQAVIEAEAPWRTLSGKTNALPSLLTSWSTNAVLLQRMVAVAELRLKQHQASLALESSPTNKVVEARKKLEETSKQLQAAVDTLAKPLDGAFTKRVVESLPTISTGRRSAFARWVADRQNPLTARVAVNHVWLRHFGRALVPTPSDFGRNGRPPTHPQLLDWLAAEFMEPTMDSGGSKQAWSFRQIHRLMVTSEAYRMASISDEPSMKLDPDNQYLWRMNSRRLEAESVRDNLLDAGGTLDLARGGPDIDYKTALKSRRRSIYLQHAAEKQAEFLQIFDGASVTECYQRQPSVMPQQALALGNSELAIEQARLLAATLIQRDGETLDPLIRRAFQKLLARPPTPSEMNECLRFLQPARHANSGDAKPAFQRMIENFVLVLLNHNEFVTVR
jgi:hypothetical protein